MATIEQIETTLQRADGYFLELAEEAYAKDIECGCADDSDSWCIAILSDQLRSRIEAGINDELTTAIYTKLLEALIPYNGDLPAVDPNAVVPGLTVIIGGAGSGGYTQPVRLYFNNNSSPQIPNWQSQYSQVFGNNPTLTVYIYSGTPGIYNEDTTASPQLTYDGTNSILQSVSYNFGVALTGYILIST